MPLGVVLVRPELLVVVEVPARELARRHPAGNRIQQAQQTLGPRPPTGKHRVMNDLVQKDCEVEYREALHDGQRQPDQRVVETDESPGGEGEDGELPYRNGTVPPATPPVQLAKCF